MPERRRIDEARLQKAESWVKIHQICQVIECLPTTNRNGSWCLVHVEWIFLESSTCESLKSKVWPYYGPGILDDSHIPMKDNCMSYCLPLQDSEQHKCPSYLNIYRFPVLCSHWWPSSVSQHLGEQQWL